MSPRRLAGLLATVLLGAVVVPVATAPQASAAGGYCAKGSGVTVVVDKGALGGTSIGCDRSGANTAGSTVVPRAGFPLTYVQRQPGFVCRVSGVPASASCGNTPPSNAYWGLFWSNGKSGTWTYSSVGIGSLKVPAGGFIGWRWQNSNTRANPGTAPVSPAAASPKPSPKPAPKPASKPSPRPSSAATSTPGGSVGGTSAGAAPSASSRAAAKPSAAAGKRVAAKQQAAKKKQVTKQKQQAERAKKKARASAPASASVSASPSAGAPSDETSASPGTRLTSGEQAADDGGSPVMLPVVAAGLLVLLLGAAGRLVWTRRKG